MKLFVDMPTVTTCEIEQCAYNFDQHCHARAITIGDDVNAWCDTMFENSLHCRRRGEAGVGACKMTGCKFNQDLECHASNVEVGLSAKHGRCRTFVAA